MSRHAQIEDALRLLRDEFGGFAEVPGIKQRAFQHLRDSGVEMGVATSATLRWVYPGPPGSCHRCGGHHDARECLIQDLVCEIGDCLRVHGPQTIDELQRHLEQTLGASRQTASEAIARWAS